MIRTPSLTCFLQLVGLISIPGLALAQTKPGPEMKEESKREWGEAVEGQAISISSEKATYAPGERIVATLSIKNAGRQDVDVTTAAFLMLYDITVLLPDGKEAPLTLFGKRVTESSRSGGSVSSQVLKPGEQISLEFDLSTLFDFSLDGKYTVWARRIVGKSAASKKPLMPSSNKVAITVDASLRDWWKPLRWK